MVGQDRSLHSILGAEFAQDRADVAFDGAFREVELSRYLGVRSSRSHQRKHIALSSGQCRDGFLRRGIGSGPGTEPIDHAVRQPRREEGRASRQPTAVLVLLGWAAAGLLLGHLVLRKRDA